MNFGIHSFHFHGQPEVSNELIERSQVPVNFLMPPCGLGFLQISDSSRSLIDQQAVNFGQQAELGV